MNHIVMVESRGSTSAWAVLGVIGIFSTKLASHSVDSTLAMGGAVWGPSFRPGSTSSGDGDARDFLTILGGSIENARTSNISGDAEDLRMLSWCVLKSEGGHKDL